MFKGGDNAKTLILFVSERSKRDEALNQLHKCIYCLTTLYNVKVANEKNLYSIYMSEPFKKVAFIYFEESGLRNKQFCECIRTSIVAKVNIVGILSEKMTKTRALSFFFSMNANRKQRLEGILDKGIQLHPDNLVSAKMLVEKIPESAGQLDTKMTRITTNIFHATNKDLEECLLHRKLVLEPPRVKQKALIFSYNHTNCNTQHNTPDKGQLRAVSETSKSLSKKLIQKTQISRPYSTSDTKSLKYKSFSKFSEGKPPEINEKQTNNQLYPSIKINNEEITAISKASTDLPRPTENTMTAVPHKVEERNNNEERKFSFDYIPKMYMVYNPGYSKNMLCVNFPSGMNQLRRNSNESSVLPPIHSTRRTSLMLATMSITSSFDDLNLDSAPEPFLFESPIPSPNQKRKEQMYQEPLPVYPDEICFPPVPGFPCEALQQRRPSVFDVLSH